MTKPVKIIDSEPVQSLLNLDNPVSQGNTTALDQLETLRNKIFALALKAADDASFGEKQVVWSADLKVFSELLIAISLCESKLGRSYDPMEAFLHELLDDLEPEKPRKKRPKKK